jgi:hypothetical protein
MSEYKDDIKIPCFNGDRSSFQLWKAKFLMMLDTRDLEQFATGIISIKGNREPIPLTSDELKSKSKKTKSLLCLCLTDEILSSVIDLETAFDVFTELCAQYENNGRGSRVRAYRHFWSLCKGPDSIKTYISKIQSAAKTVSICGGFMDTQLIVDKILAGLTAEYDSLVMLLDSTETSDTQSDITVAKITQLLQNFESQVECTMAHNIQYANVATSLNKPVGQSCRLHPLSSHSDAKCIIQHPELKPAIQDQCRIHPLSRHTNRQCYSQKSAPRTFSNDNIAHTSMYPFVSRALSASVPLSIGNQQREPSSACNCYIVDCGSSNHMSSTDLNLINYEHCDGPCIELGDMRLIKSAGIGSGSLHDSNGNLIQLSNVFHVPELKKNLLSIGQSAASGCKFVFDNDVLSIYMDSDYRPPLGKPILTIQRDQDNLYRVRCNKHQECSNSSSTVNTTMGCFAKRYEQVSAQTWHERLGHVNSRYLSKLEKSGSIHIEPGTVCDDFCNPCLASKLTRAPFKTSNLSTTRPGELVFSDLAVLPCVGRGGYRYFVTYIDHFTRHTTVFLLRSKAEQFQALKQYQAKISTKFKGQIIQLESFQSDNGGEYMSNEFRQYLSDQGIHHRTIVAGNPESNGLPERLNRSILEIAQ